MKDAQDQIEDPVLRDVVERIIEVASPDKIILFGSRAVGSPRPGSDIDLLVVARVPHRRKTAQAIYARLYGVRVPVDVVVVTPEDVDRYGDRVGSVIRPALREGRVIYAA